MPIGEVNSKRITDWRNFMGIKIPHHQSFVNKIDFILAVYSSPTLETICVSLLASKLWLSCLIQRRNSWDALPFAALVLTHTHFKLIFLANSRKNRSFQPSSPPRIHSLREDIYIKINRLKELRILILHISK